ncbi:transposase family protein, partial [Sporosarcina limicola]
MNNQRYQGPIFEYFEELSDTRQEGKVRHKLTDILFIMVTGVICGLDEWDDIHFWASSDSSQQWLKKYI